jgi:hypothetical protein
MLPRLTAIVLCLPTLALAELVSLRQRWEPGKTYTLQTTTDTLMKDAADASMSVTQTTDLKADRDAKNQKQTTVKVTFVGTKAKVVGRGQTATFDSTDQANSHPALVGSLGPAVGKTFTLVYDEKQRFKELRDLDTISSAPGVAPGLLAVEEAKNVGVLFRKSIEIGLPAVPVEVGSTWTADEVITLAKVGEVHADITGKLQKIEEKNGHSIATITFDGNLRSTKAGTEKAPMALGLTKGSTMSGTILFDLNDKVVTQYNGLTQFGLDTGVATMAFQMKETRRLLNVQPNSK